MAKNDKLDSKSAEDLKKVGKAAAETKKETDELGDSLTALTKNFTDPVQLLIGKFNDMGSAGRAVAGAFALVAMSIGAAAEASQKFVSTLGKIKGINGQMGNLAKSITAAATGSVSKQDIADFLAATSDLFQSADAMKGSTSFINDLIGMYGDVNVAADKFRSILLLSADAQKEMVQYADEYNAIVQASPAGQLQATQKALEEIAITIGGDLMYVLEPLLDLIGGIANALRTLRGEQKTVLTEAESYAQLQALAEKYGMTLEELNAIERGGYSSSLDEVHTSDGGQLAAEDTLGLGGLKESTENVDGMNKSLAETDDTMQTLIETVMILFEVFETMFDAIGPDLLELIRFLADVVEGFIEWLDATGLLEPVLGVLLGIVIGIAAIKFASWISSVISGLIALIAPTTAATAAQGALAASGIAAAGATTFGAAVPVILAAIGVGIAGIAALGIFSGSVGGGSVPSYDRDDNANTRNDYGGTANEGPNTSVSVYLDGRKVNDELANDNYYNEEVKIT